MPVTAESLTFVGFDTESVLWVPFSVHVCSSHLFVINIELINACRIKDCGDSQVGLRVVTYPSLITVIGFTSN